MKYPKGAYVVLLKSCDGGNCWNEEFPIDHVYKLRRESSKNNFHPEMDLTSSGCNGWSSGASYRSRMDMRYATGAEIKAYNTYNKPVSVLDVYKIIDTYEIY